MLGKRFIRRCYNSSMSFKKRIVVGNWKMSPETVYEAKEIFSKIKRRAKNYKKVQVVICPPDLHVVPLVKIAARSGIHIGVQDVFWEDEGFFTGQISPKMAYDAGARFAILGHSERRKMGESSSQVAKKVSAVIRDKIVAVLCVGENARDPEGNYLSFLREQIMSSLVLVSKEAVKAGLIIAYEPVWEIGRKDMKSMNPADLRQTVIFIKKVLFDAYGDYATQVPILYGGSVSSINASSLIADGDISGFLVGRQSLDPNLFGEILKSAHEAR